MTTALTWLLLRILTWFLVAALIGGVVGWLLKRAASGRRQRELEDEWQGKLEREKESAWAARTELTETEQRLTTVRRERDEHLAALSADLAGSQQKLEDQRRRLENMLKEQTERVRELESAKANLEHRFSTELQASQDQAAGFEAARLEQERRLKGDLAGKSEELVGALDRASELESAKADLEAKLEAELTPLRSELQAAQERATDLEVARAEQETTLTGELEYLRSELNAAKDYIVGLEAAKNASATRDIDVESLRVALAEAQECAVSLESDRVATEQRLTAELETLRQELEETLGGYASGESAEDESGDSSELEKLRASLAEAEDRAAVLASDKGELEQRLAAEEVARVELQARHDRDQGDGDLESPDLTALRSELVVEKDQVAELARELDAARAELEQTRQRSADLEDEKSMLENNLETLLETGSAAPMVVAPEERDDLKKLYGVGQTLEKLLNNLGVYTFRQVALWDKSDIEWAAAKLAELPGRIERDDWVGGARKEHLEKYGEAL